MMLEVEDKFICKIKHRVKKFFSFHINEIHFKFVEMEMKNMNFKNVILCTGSFFFNI